MMAPPSGPAPPTMPHLPLLTPLSVPSPAHPLPSRLFSTLVGSLLVCWLLLCQPVVQAAAVATGTWEHGLAAYVAPKYPRGYRHFDYVNPDAPKGGVLKLPNPDRRSSFDKFNPFTVKGVAPAAMTMFVFETLAFTSMDEPNTFYGLIAEEMLVAPDLSSISFRIHPKARFSNGDPVTPEDVVHSYLQLSGKGASPAYQTNFAVVSKAVVVDARTVRFDMKERTLDALSNVAGLQVFSRKWGQVGGVSKPTTRSSPSNRSPAGPTRSTRSRCRAGWNWCATPTTGPKTCRCAAASSISTASSTACTRTTRCGARPSRPVSST